jgi:ArsR family transcriptional regulator
MSYITRTQLKDKVKPFAKKMAAVGDPLRLAIVYLLSHGEKSFQELVFDIHESAPLLSHHLQMLLTTKWISKRRKGKEVYFSLNDQANFELLHLLKDTPKGRSWENTKVKQWYR